MLPRNFRRRLNVAARRNRKKCCALLMLALLCVSSVLQFLKRIPTEDLEVHDTVPAENDSWRIYCHSEEEFKRNYAYMEKNFKVYMYPEEEFLPLKMMKNGTEEYYFFNSLKWSQFLTDDPDTAHLFFIPIFTNVIRVKGENYEKNITSRMTNYVEKLIHEYPFWNRTQGSDHFFLDCKQFGVKVIHEVPLLLNNSIRLSCSPTETTGYVLRKQVTIPKLHPWDQVTIPKRYPWDSSKRRINPWVSPRRRINDDWNLADLWESYRNYSREKHQVNTRELPMNGPSPYIITYNFSKFCVKPGCDYDSRSYAYHRCVPVMMCDRRVMPFADLLVWENFTVLMDKADESLMNNLLKNISTSQFLRLSANGIQARKHFQWTSPPAKYDAFHTVMYQLWLPFKNSSEIKYRSEVESTFYKASGYDADSVMYDR